MVTNSKNNADGGDDKGAYDDENDENDDNDDKKPRDTHIHIYIAQARTGRRCRK